MNRLASHFGRLLVLLVFLAAAWLLYDRLKEYTFGQIREAIAAMPTWHIVAASLLTVLNYVILIGYDWLAVRWVGEKDLPLRKIALASFAGYAFSYNFGATLFGTSIRYRLYSAWGVPLLKIVKLLVILGLTFWFNTLPVETLDAYRDHGEPKARLEQDVERAGWVLERLSELGISIDKVAQQLEDEGVEKFNKPFDELMEALEERP